MMSKVELIEEQVRGLSAQELAEFRDWFAEFDWEAWDRQFERDAIEGRLDAHGGNALRDHAAGS